MSRSLQPLFVTVTWGAGGSTADKSLELAELTQRELGITTCLHLTCTNMKRKVLDEALAECKRIGVRNILALRGDPPRAEEYRDTEEVEEVDGEFVWAVDLVKYIRKTHGDYFCLGVAAYPEGHADESHPAGQSLEQDLPYLVDKIQAGADFIMTQLFFDVQAYDKFEERLRNHESGVFKSIPIIPGMMPIQSYQILKRTAKLSHAKLPDSIVERLDEVRGDDESVKKVGVEIVSEIVEKVKEIKSRSPGPKGFHFYTLNLEKAVSFILERTKLLAPPTPQVGKFDSAITDGDEPVNGELRPHRRSSRRQSSVGADPHNRVVVDDLRRLDFEASAAEAGIPKETVNTRAVTLAISEGEGTLGREATWDDFPNGRWGDARSPAYGEIDGYGVSLHMSVTSAIKLWGHPVEPSDITKLFIRHIEGDLSALPWSEEGLNEETLTIREQLLKVNKKGWWTVASQPAVNGVRSNDRVFGWGPKNGFVFQKAFVELFMPDADYQKLKLTIENDENISYLAASGLGEFESSADKANDLSASIVSLSAQNHGETNAVTWGAFPGKEIVTPTIIEEVSFRAWAEEAFGIWSEWERVYPPRSATKQLIKDVREGYWLVNIIHHAYVEKEALWELLTKE